MAKSRDGITKVTSDRTAKVSYQARLTFVDFSGQRQWVSGTFPTRKLATEFLVSQKAARQQGQYIAPSRITLGEYAEQWLERHAQSWASSTAYTRRKQWEKHLAPRLGGMRLTSITRATCQFVVDDLGKAGLGPQSIRNYHALMSGILGSALDDELIPRNPALRLVMPDQKPREMHIWNQDQVRHFLTSTATAPNHALYYLMLTTGLRLGEAMALRWSNVNLRLGKVSITDTMRRQESGRFLPEAGTKTKRPRTISLTASCLRALEAHKAEQDASRQVAPVWDIRGFVFANSEGQPLGHLALVAAIDADIQAAGLPRLTPHQFRHTAISILMALGVHPTVVAQIAGHQQIAMTIGTYTHLADNAQDDAIKKLSDILALDDRVSHS